MKYLALITRRLPKIPGIERLAHVCCPPSGFYPVEYYDLRLDGFEFRVRPSSYIGWSLFVFGQYERVLRDIASKYVKSGDTIVEVGANVGWHTLFFSKLVGAWGNVIAFEPSPLIFAELRDNVRRKQRIREL